jgi:hypothetical protein
LFLKPFNGLGILDGAGKFVPLLPALNVEKELSRFKDAPPSPNRLATLKNATGTCRTWIHSPVEWW